MKISVGSVLSSDKSRAAISGKSGRANVDLPDVIRSRSGDKITPYKAMKYTLPLVIFGAAVLTSAQAQLVHLSFKDPEGLFLFRANSALIPWDHTTGDVSKFDIFYDPAADLSVPLDPAKNVWRAIVTSSLGNFEVVRPIQSITDSGNYLEFQYNSEPPLGYGLMDFSVSYTASHADSSLPVPPIDLGESNLYLSGGLDFFNIPHLGEGYGYAGFSSATAETASSVDFTPVPEPSTYALGAVALLGLVLWKRHGRAAPSGI